MRNCILLDNILLSMPAPHTLAALPTVAQPAEDLPYVAFFGFLSWGDTDPRVEIVRYMGDHGRICHFRDIYPSFRVYPSFIPYIMENFGHIRHFSHIYPSFQAVPSPMPCNKLTSTSSSVSSLFFHFQIKK